MAWKRNITAAKKLVEEYRSITLEQIKELAELEEFSFLGRRIAIKLTGFSQHNTCTLCKSVGIHGNITDRCVNKCIYSRTNGCHLGENNKTYYKINDAKTPKQLLNGFRKRADHIEKLLKKIEKQS